MNEMNSILVLLLGAVAFASAMWKGVRWTFCWVYVPVLVLIPWEIRSDLPGLTELSSQGAAGVGLLAAYFLGGRRERCRWQWFDALTLLPVFTFAVSYGLSTDLNGALHRFRMLVLEWGLPYVFTRLFVRDFNGLLRVLRPLALSSLVMAFLAVWECRMAVRLAPTLWNKAGFDITVLDHLGGWRWGFLRAAASMGHPLSLGTFFAMVTPLMMVWCVLEPKFRWTARLAVIACFAGGVAAVSRGPILVLTLAAILPALVWIPRKIWVPGLLLFAILALPSLLDMAQEEVELAGTAMKRFGNTTSGHYRVALLIIYGTRLSEVGWWGSAEVQIHPEYQKAWSIDNAYLYLFMVGGWIGGGLYFAIIFISFYWAIRSLTRAPPQFKSVYTMVIGSLVGVSGCMANVWMASDYAPFFWIATALVFNLVVLSARAGVKEYKPYSATRAGQWTDRRNRYTYDNVTARSR